MIEVIRPTGKGKGGEHYQIFTKGEGNLKGRGFHRPRTKPINWGNNRRGRNVGVGGENWQERNGPAAGVKKTDARVEG